MVTSYYDAASGELIHQAGYKARDPGYKEALDSGLKDDIRPNLLILNGMLLRVGVRILVPRSPGLQKPEEHSYPDLAGTYSLQKIDPQYGPDDEEKLVQLFDRFAEYAISNPALALDSDSASYIRGNLGRVVDYLGPKLREGHLTIYKLRCGKSLEKNGAFVFLDVSDREKPVFLYPAFGLRAFTFANGFVPWRPGREEMYLPDVDPNLRRRRPDSSSAF